MSARYFEQALPDGSTHKYPNYVNNTTFIEQLQRCSCPCINLNQACKCGGSVFEWRLLPGKSPTAGPYRFCTKCSAEHKLPRRYNG